MWVWRKQSQEWPESRHKKNLGRSKYRHHTQWLVSSATDFLSAFELGGCGMDVGAIGSVHLNLIVVWS